jgi:DNA-binding phage protein
MVRAKISPEQKKSSKAAQKPGLKAKVGLKKLNPSKQLTDKKFIGAAILECLNNNDPEGVMEMISIYINALKRSKSQFLACADLPRTTAYHSLRNKNPTIKTLAKWMHAAHVQAQTDYHLKAS